MGFDDFVRIGSFRSMHPEVLHKAGNVSTRKAMTKVRLGLNSRLDEVTRHPQRFKDSYGT